MEGMVLGRDYQICPNSSCSQPVQLAEACNHITCPRASCRTEFCYICGQEVEDGDDHYTVGKPCPRYNQPGAEQAMYDDDVMDDDEDMDRFLDDDSEPLLEGPPPGQTWFDLPEQAERNAARFIRDMRREVRDTLVMQIPPTVSPRLDELASILNASFNLQFELYRMLFDGQLIPDTLQDLLEMHLEYGENHSFIQRSLVWLRPYMEHVRQHLPLLTQAIAFYQLNSAQVVDDATARRTGVRDDQQQAMIQQAQRDDCRDQDTPALDGPAQGQSWADLPDQAELNAIAYVIAIQAEVAEEVAACPELNDLVGQLCDNIEFQFGIQQVLSRGWAPRALAVRVEQYQRADAEIVRLLAASGQTDIRLHFPLLAGAIEFYTKTKDDFRLEVHDTIIELVEGELAEGELTEGELTEG